MLLVVGRKAKTEPTEVVHSRILAERERAGLSRQDFADAIGVHYQTVGYLERGEYNPSLVLALRIARLLNRNVESLFSLDPLPTAISDEGVVDVSME
jgi:DNA-binding XRE family transcriptional regulator